MEHKFSFILPTIFYLLFSTQNYFAQSLSSKNATGKLQFQKGAITVKLKDKLPHSLPKAAQTFGVSSLDEILIRHDAKGITKRFNHRPILEGSGLPDLSKIYKIELPDETDIEKIVDEFSKDPNVEYAEPVPLYYPLEVPDDSLYPLQSHLLQIKAEEAWDIHKCENGSRPIIIGICDTGVKWDHPDLIDNIWQNFGEDADNDGHVIEWADTVWILDPGDRNGIDDDGNGYADDFIGWNSMEVYGEDPSNPTDPDGHGTHVAGIAAATTNNGIGVAGISWNAKILSACQSSDLSPYPGYIINGFEGIIYLAEAGADIINCSWGNNSYYRATEEAIKYATMLGSIVVCAVGNDHSTNVNFPAKYPYVVAVGGVELDDRLQMFSNYGPAIDVTAPYSILSTSFTDNYVTKGGTSMSSPLVAGLLALIKSYFPDLNNDQLIEQLVYTSDNIDDLNPGKEDIIGRGRINAFRALTENTFNIPQLYRIDINEAILDISSTNAIQAGKTSSINFTAQNFSNYFYNDKVRFHLSTDDPDVEIIENEVARTLLPDDYNYFHQTFEIRINENAKYHEAILKISAESDIPLVMIDYEFALEILPVSGILVYEMEEDNSDCSGVFIRDFFTGQGYDVNYLTGYSFPSSLNGFDAVFFSFGNSDYSAGLPTQVIENYLNDGGKLYVEGGRLFNYLTDNKSLLGLMGLENAYYSEGTENPIDGLSGMDGTIAEGFEFNQSDQENVGSIEIYEPNIIGKAAFTESDYGIVGVQNEGLSGQKTFCFSYGLSPIVDANSVSRRVNFLSQLCSFFDLPIGFNADFEARITKGKSPLTVKFYDLSLPDPGNQITTRKWDFNNDNIVDSEELFPEWTYNEEGLYSVKLEVTDGSSRAIVKKDDYITVLGGETALQFNGEDDYFLASVFTLNPDSVLTLDSTLTFEAWINPYEGELSSGIDYIFEKISVKVAFDCQEKALLFITLHDDGTYAYITTNTPSNSIITGQWQHVAATYNASLNKVKIFINGIEQPLTADGEPNGLLYNNPWYGIYIGNAMFTSNTYYGAIDEIRIWNIDRSAENISEFMNKGLVGDEEGLVGYWPLNEAFGNEVLDYSIYNHAAYIGNTEWVEGVKGLITSIDPGNNNVYVPDSYTLFQNYPNPFNPETKIKYQLAKPGQVKLIIYNLLGREVIRLVNEYQTAGTYEVRFDASNLSSGVFFYTLLSSDYRKTKKMVLIK